MENNVKLIALCTSRLYDPQIHGFIVILNERLKKEGYALLIFAINSDIYWEEDRQAAERYVFNLIPYDEVSAVIIMDEKIKSKKISGKIIDAALSKNIPVVVSDGRYDRVSCINFDYEKGFEKVVRHVIEDHGVKRPHMMAGQPDNEFSNRRIDVFKKVIEENGIPFDQSMISYGYFWADPCEKAMKELLKREELPEAIICANDNMALTVSDMLMESGRRVPEDIIVTGFDGYDEIFFTSPKITSVSCDIIHLADDTVDVVLETIADKKLRSREIIPQFIANESCGCPGHTENLKLLRSWFKESFARNNDDNRVLQQMTSQMQTSDDPAELATFMDSYKTECLMAVVDRRIFDEDRNYFTDEEYPEGSKEFIILYDDDHKKMYKRDTFTIAEGEDGFKENVLSPSIRKRVFELLESGYPLLFNSLDFMNRPFGFACYYFRNYTISNYSNTMGITNAVSTGVGGYVNLQYQRRLLEKMDSMYRHDPLTGLYNRIGFQNIFKKLRKMPEYRNQEIMVIMSDLDGLKYINDNFGHAEGDNAIYTVAQSLFRAVPQESLSVRFGGDEIFSLVLGDCDPEEIIGRVHRYLGEYNRVSEKPYKVSASSGYIKAILDEDFDITQTLKEADNKMYAIKKAKKRNSVRESFDTDRVTIRDVKPHKERAEGFVTGLSLDEKMSVIFGSTEEKKKLKLRYIDFSGEAAHGVQARHDQSFDKGTPVHTTVFPNPIGMASSFDKQLMHDIGDVVGVESRSLLNEGLHSGICQFAPTVDMERDPRWGRNEEGYGEDPHLASRMAGEYIIGMAGDDENYVRCGATLKHFYGNNVEEERYTADSVMPEGLREDYYKRVFKETIEYSHPLSVMSSYNKINGLTSTFNPELTTFIKALGVPLVVSDAFTIKRAQDMQKVVESGAESVTKAVKAGVDLFLEDPAYLRPAMDEALRSGMISEADIDNILINKLTVYSMLGLFEDELLEDGSSKAFPKTIYNKDRVNTAPSRALSRKAAYESVVMLKNEDLLPLDTSKKIHAFGPFSNRCPIDWYSGVSDHFVTISEGMGIGHDDLFPRVRIKLDRGRYAGIKGDKVVPVEEDSAEVFELMLWDESRITIRSLSTGKLLTTISPEKGVVNVEEPSESFELYATEDDAFSWFANEAFQMLDARGEVIRFDVDNALTFYADERIRRIKNVDGSMELSFEVVDDVISILRKAMSEHALDYKTPILACFGLHPIVNCKEERDRESIELPPFQRAVLRELRLEFVNIVLILVANAPLAIAEEDAVFAIKSILWTAHGSEELGNGIADILMGRKSPAGRLCETWYTGDDRLPDINDYDIEKTGMTYLFMKHEPLYRFGFGLSYSEFESELLFASKNTSAKDHINYEIRIKNVGHMVSDYVVQIYETPENDYLLYGNDRLGRDVTGFYIPVGSRLVAFERVHDIGPGEIRTVKS